MQGIRTIRAPFAALACLWVSAAFGQSAFVAGPLERLSGHGAQVSILGQTYVIDRETIFKVNGRKVSSLVGIQVLQSGALVVVESKESAGPLTASSIAITSTQYVPGASVVFVGGSVTQVAPQGGTIQVGELVVDISAARPEVSSQIGVGAFVEVIGIQPSPQGLLLGQEISVRLQSQSIGGTGIAVSTESIGGTGKSVSVQSIGGTGAAVSAQSIGGTGKSVSVQSIGGTGAAVSAQSIGGTGKSVSVQSIGGTGAAVSAQSIGGTGKSVSIQSIGGTGAAVSAQSIGGTGLAAQ